MVTKGIICKGILGVNSLRLGATPSEDTPAVSALPHNLREGVPTNAKYIEKIAYVTYKIVTETGNWDEFNLKEAWTRSRTGESPGNPRDTGDGASHWVAREAPSPRRGRREEDDPWRSLSTRWTGAAERGAPTGSPDEEPGRWEETLTLLVVGAVALKRDPMLRNHPRIRETVRTVTRSLNGQRPGSDWLLEVMTAACPGPGQEASPRAAAPWVRRDQETEWGVRAGVSGRESE